MTNGGIVPARYKKNRSGDKSPERLLKVVVSLLANARPQEAVTALHAHFATGQKVCHGCDSFLGALSAGADDHNQIAERQFWTLSQDKVVLLHCRDLTAP